MVKLLFDDDLLIGHYAAVPVDLSVGGKQMRAIHSLDTMVHPDYRGRGIFTFLADMVYRESSRTGYHLVYGFPNKNSYHGFVSKLGWLGFGNINAFVAESRSLRRRSSSTESARSVLRLNEFDSSADLLWERCKEREKVAVNRTSRYLNWRYVMKPEVDYQIYGLFSSIGELKAYAVTKVYGRNGILLGHIVDILCDDYDHVPALLQTCYSHLLDEQVTRITCWANASSPVGRQLKFDGFKREMTETYFGAKPLVVMPGISLIGSYENWHITMGDSDVF